MTVSTLRRLQTRAELIEAAGLGDAFARLEPADHIEGYAVPGAVGFVRLALGRHRSLTAWGDGLGDLLDHLATSGEMERLAPGFVTVPLDSAATLRERMPVEDFGRWEWMWTERAPRHTDQEDRLVELDDARDAAEIAELGRENPRWEGWPGTGRCDLWLGARDDEGRLIACGTVHRLESGVAHLSGILVAKRHRGEGLGRAITAELTRRIIAAEGVCTLSLYSDNDTARTLYLSLGYVLDKRWSSHRVRHTVQ